MGLDQENAHQLIQQILRSIVIFHTNLWAGANCKFMLLVKLQILCGCSYTEKVYTQWSGTIKIDPHKSCHLKSRVTVIFLRFIKNTYFYVVKQKNRKQLHWLFLSKKTVTVKQHLSENLTFQNLLKNRKLLPAKKFGYFGFSWLFIRNLKESYYHISPDSFI